LFVGFNDGIACIDADKTCLLDKIDFGNPNSENTQIISIHTVRLKQGAHFVLSLTDSGIFYMHLFVVNKFYPINSGIDMVSLIFSKFNKEKKSHFKT
jgi:hypothetical protein